MKITGIKTEIQVACCYQMYTVCLVFTCLGYKGSFVLHKKRELATFHQMCLCAAPQGASHFILLLFSFYIRVSICFTNISVCLFFVPPNKKLGYFFLANKDFVSIHMMQNENFKKKCNQFCFHLWEPTNG